MVDKNTYHIFFEIDRGKDIAPDIIHASQHKIIDKYGKNVINDFFGDNLFCGFKSLNDAMFVASQILLEGFDDNPLFVQQGELKIDEENEVEFFPLNEYRLHYDI